MSNDAAIIRTILARECDTVNEYETLATRAENPAIRELVNHFAKEEKEHIAECVNVLRHLDPQFDEMMNKPIDHALGDSAEALLSKTSVPTETAPSEPKPVTSLESHSASADSQSYSVHGLKTMADPDAFTIGGLFK